MWLLCYILLLPIDGIASRHILSTFTTYAECRAERDRIGFAMAESYPYEMDFKIECQLSKRAI